MEELGISFCGVGQATVGRIDLDRGCEPDLWYYFGDHARQMRGIPSIDFNRDPPPDLAIEIEHSRSFVDRIGILAAMGVPELWRLDATRLRIFLLQSDGRYLEKPSSHFLPELPPGEIVRVLKDADHFEDLVLCRNFRQWVRQNLVSQRLDAASAIP